MTLSNAVLPDVEEEVRTWVRHSACRGVDPSVFYPEGVVGNRPKDHDPVVDPRSVADMQDHIKTKYCTGCVVQRSCREYAIATGQTKGVWGGLNEFELKLAVRRRQTQQN